MTVSAHTRDDYRLTNDMKSQVDQAVQDTIVAIRIVDAFKAPQGSGTSYLNAHANFPYEYVLLIRPLDVSLTCTDFSHASQKR